MASKPTSTPMMIPAVLDPPPLGAGAGALVVEAVEVFDVLVFVDVVLVVDFVGVSLAFVGVNFGVVGVGRSGVFVDDALVVDLVGVPGGVDTVAAGLVGVERSEVFVGVTGGLTGAAGVELLFVFESFTGVCGVAEVGYA